MELLKVNLNQMNKERKELINNLKPYEMEAYLKSLISNLYEAYLEQDSEKALASKRLIEEATEIYLAEGYVNSFSKELEFRLAKANEVIVQVLEEKDKLEVNLSFKIVEDLYLNYIDNLKFYNYTLKLLVNIYEVESSEEVLSGIKNILERAEAEVIGIETLLEKSSEDAVPELTSMLEEHYSNFRNLARKINSF